MFEGIYVALITPFRTDLSVDHDALTRLAQNLIDRGVHGLVPCGTTGESATLSHQEHADVVKTVVRAANNRVPVIAGTGSNSTQEAIFLTQAAEKAGASATLHITPYYNKPTQEGLYQHFSAIDQASQKPIILYNIPGRTAVNMEPDTVGRLAQLSKIVGIKEATSSTTYLSELRRRVSPDFKIFAGDDAFFLPMLALGGHGVISVAAHLVPEAMVALWQAWKSKNHNQALTLHDELFPLIQALFIETNPSPIKAALAELGVIAHDHLRLPMVGLSQPARAKLREALAQNSYIERA